MKPAPPVTNTLIGKPFSLALHPTTYTVLLRRVSTMSGCLATYLPVGDVAHGKQTCLRRVGRIGYFEVQLFRRVSNL